MTTPTVTDRYRALWARWFVIVSIVAGLGLAVALNRVAPLLRTSALWGWATSFVLCGAGGWLAFWSLRQQTKTFMLVLFGGMAARLLVAGVALVVAVLAFNLDPAGFAIGLLASYAVYQFIEIAIVQRQQSAARSLEHEERE